MNTITLYRPVNDKELELIKEMDFKGFPPRLPEQPIFYPVMNEAYAIQITKDWNVPAYGCGFVTKFDMDATYLKKFKIENVGGEIHNELWVPSEELEEFNSHIIGEIEVIGEYR
ncbi:ADP-ribosylation/crystallin J1 [Aureivirga marina]|uniref:ADP-ribosylation/crystallin J1 n=1 Tax=Aureivirga marina TaxID=1182451 RepID=UPI0018C912FA|nr:ADP-ribosylation/crystallin J1 [Aureivirga marina]